MWLYIYIYTYIYIYIYIYILSEHIFTCDARLPHTNKMLEENWKYLGQRCWTLEVQRLLYESLYCATSDTTACRVMHTATRLVIVSAPNY